MDFGEAVEEKSSAGLTFDWCKISMGNNKSN